MNKYKIALVAAVFSMLSMNQASAWHCGQRCPSSVFSGKLECQAYQAGCSVGNAAENAITDLTSSTINIKNECNDVLLVTVEYIPIAGSDFITSNFVFSPDEKANTATTKNRYFYLSAKSHPSYSKKNYVWKRNQVDIGSSYTDYTYSLSCN